MYNISIIIRTSTRYIFLDRAINDIKEQTYQHWKIILVNDGGDLEKINAIIRKYHLSPDQCKVINNEGSLGLFKAINLGTKAVDTEFVVIHDDDDTWDKSFLEETVGYLQKYQDCMGVITHTNKVTEKVCGNEIKVCQIKAFNSHLKDVVSIYDMIKNNLYSPISFVYRAKVYEEIGYYDESLKVLEDWEFNIRFMMKYDIYIIEKPLANYHIRKQSNIKNEYKNTVVAKKKLHQKYDTLIRNRYLRQDLEEHQLGIGTLMNLLKWSDNRVMRRLKQYLGR